MVCGYHLQRTAWTEKKKEDPRKKKKKSTAAAGEERASDSGDKAVSCAGK